MEMAMAGSRMGSLAGSESLGNFRGDREMRGLVGKGVGLFSDRSHERFYALRLRCGKKEKNLGGRLAKAQALVDVQRNLVLLSRSVSIEQAGGGSVGGLQLEGSIQMGIADPNVGQYFLCRIMKNLEDLQAEVQSLNVKAMKKKKESPSSSSSSSSSESSDSDDMGKAVDMRALRKRKNSAKHTRAALSVAAQIPASDHHCNSISIAPLETYYSQTHAVADAISSGTLQSFHSAERKAAGMALAVTTSDDTGEEEPAIVAQIRALCSTATSATTREIYRRGPIELKGTPSGRVVVDTTSPSVLSPEIPLSTDVSTSGKIEVCTVGRCKRGGSQQILASLQGRIPESSDISVTSCKCMGKCKSGPNVRVENGEGEAQLHSHVSVDDVDTLLELHFGVQSSASQIGGMPMLFARVDSSVAAA